MSRFVEGEHRSQLSLMPTSLDEYLDAENPVRVIDIFIDEVDLATLGFAGPANTGRPGYHPATLLKIYLYGYLNRIQSSRRLEREAGRNVELMWLTGRLAPDFKTISDFRRDNGAAIQAVCARFIAICGQVGLFRHAVAAIDGAKFKAVNSRDRNFTRGKLKRRMEQIADSIDRYLQMLDTADAQEANFAEPKATRLREKIAAMRGRLAELEVLESQVLSAPDLQISLTDPDARAMATNMRGASVVGYNVQAAVDTQHHLIVAHEVTNSVVDRSLLAPMAAKTKDAMGVEHLEALADRGYFSGEQIKACAAIGVTPLVPKPLTSNAKADGRFSKDDFVFLPEQNAYRCPANEILGHRHATIENDMTIHVYYHSKCGQCPLKAKCTTGKERRIRRWEHEHVVEAALDRLAARPDAMTVRRRTVEHTFGTLKSWMGHTHFLTRGLPQVATEMSLCVLAYNFKRMLSILGSAPLVAAIRA